MGKFDALIYSYLLGKFSLSPLNIAWTINFQASIFTFFEFI